MQQPPSQPLPSGPLSGTQKMAPTAGAAVGAVVGGLIASKLGLTDPVYVSGLVGVVGTIFTAVFHYLAVTWLK